MSASQPVPDAAVRTARVADAAAVGAVQSTVWRAAYVDLLPAEAIDGFDAATFTEVWTRSLQEPPTPQHRLLVATRGEDVVGLVAVGPTEDAGRGEVLVLCVLPDARRTGHGSRLLNAAVDTLRANDFREVETWVPATDESARRFLEGAGLHADGAWRDRAVSDDGRSLREVRLLASITDE
ncbi:GNAT family N-acetyltransferase [Luteipulveratus sp. YIM 133132]|uniref:GNAT family N-acetyltransferase n=1 Tax=Luteipulveratus flavus TaxID=3031728 RepID=UPI0023B17D40|nr:GNAT family N-acetyltransferase [Luteipulveratus sp. YIM 133132]MDE9366240.1 GNAT family N-acetyltransferase [Luteipulveratus sp. YIM 133132]